MIRYTVEKLLDLDYYTEGPVTDRQGNYFFTTLSGGAIQRFSGDAGITVWAEGDCPNGQLVMKNGEHWLCESRKGQITAYSANGSFKEVICNRICAGIPFSTPNDLVADSMGNVYFTDSVRGDGKVFFIGVNGKQRLIADGIDYANGLVLNHSEDILYVAESYGNRVLAFDLRSSDRKTPRKTLVDLPAHPSGDPVKNLPDGLALDLEGRIWVAHYGMQAIQVVTPDGRILSTLDTGLPLTSNLTFTEDTPSRKKILITGGYDEPGPGAVVLATVMFEVQKDRAAHDAS